MPVPVLQCWECPEVATHSLADPKVARSEIKDKKPAIQYKLDNYKKPQSWYNLYWTAGFLSVISVCSIHAFAMACPVLAWAIVLRIRYHVAIMLRVRYAMSGTKPAYMLLQVAKKVWEGLSLICRKVTCPIFLRDPQY